MKDQAKRKKGSLFQRIIRLQILGVLLVAMMTLLVPSIVYAQAYPDVELDYYHGRQIVRIYDMDGNLIQYARGIGIYFATQDDSIVTGEVDLYEASTARGSRLNGGTGVITGRFNRVGLAEGTNTITVSTFGTHSIYLPPGVEAVATSGTATVNGSPLSLDSGTTPVTTTGNGDFTILVSLSYVTIGDFQGVIGEGRAARFQLIGTTFAASATDGTYTATLTGDPVTFHPPGTVLDISSAGTFGVTIPHGIVAEATSGTATLVGSPVTLTPGDTTVLDTGVTTGTVTITMTVATGYNIAGFFRYNRAGDITYLRGRIDGFVVLDPETWTTLVFNAPFKAAYEPGD